MNKSTFTHRPLDDDEVPLIHRLEREATGTNLGPMEQLTRFLEQPDNYCFVAVRGRAVSGFVLFSVQPDRQRVALVQLVALPGEKHQGARRFLLETLCRNADQTGYTLGFAASDADLELHLLLKELDFQATRVVGSEYLFLYPRPGKALGEK
jgi:hypothetical protein